MFLGLDLGTSNVKAVLADAQGQLYQTASQHVALRHGPEGAVEQDLEEIWTATLDVLRHCASAVSDQGLPPIQALGVSSQGAACLVTDREGKPLLPVCSWLDGRGSEEDAAFTAKVGRDWLGRHTGHTSSAMTIGQVLRWHQASPALLAPPNRLRFVGDAIVERLCGHAAHDATSAAIAMLLNPTARAYDPDLLGFLNLSVAQLPSLLPATEPAGPLLRQVADRSALPRGIPVSPAIHDQYAAALATGVIHDGDILFGAGTAWVLLVVTARGDTPAHPDAFVAPHPIHPLYGQIISLRNGGSAYAWITQLLGLTHLKPAELEALAAVAPPGSHGVRFWPFLAETLPAAVNAKVSGKFEGLRLSSTPSDLLRAVEEGLACELNRHLVLLRQGGVSPRRLILCGGPAKSQLTPHIIANITGLPLDLPAEASSALGAAMLASALTNPSASLKQIVSTMQQPVRRVQPDAKTELYQHLARDYTDAVAAGQLAPEPPPPSAA